MLVRFPNVYMAGTPVVQYASVVLFFRSEIIKKKCLISPNAQINIYVLVPSNSSELETEPTPLKLPGCAVNYTRCHTVVVVRRASNLAICEECTGKQVTINL